MFRSTIVFLILLRLAIGWHFFFEGWHKIHTTSLGKTETSRPFSSEGYFRNASGPLAPFARAEIGDLDDAALARLTPKPVPAGKNPTDVPPAERLPDTLGQEIDDYTKRFLASFHLDDAEKAQEAADEAKPKVAVFLMNSVSGGQHITEYRAKLAELRRLLDDKKVTLGRDADSARITALRADVAKARKESLDDLDKELGKDLRDPLSAIIKTRLDAADPAAVPKGDDAFAYLLPPSDGKTLPKDYESRWDRYFEAFKAAYPLSEAQLKTAEAKLQTAKELTVKWLTVRQTVLPGAVVAQLDSPDPNPFFTAATALAVRDGLVKGAAEENEQMRRYLNAALTDDQAKGAPPTAESAPPTFLSRLDKVTMWALVVMGACLLLGLLTRLNCVLAAGFLAMTYVLYPPFPWLPQPPNNEGNYLFVNKNLVELLALLVLATTLSGRWFGLDALLHRLFSRRKPAAAPARPAARAA